MKSKLLVSCSFAALAAVCAASAVAQTEIQWWHSMTAVNGEWVNDLAKDFNASQKEYKVVADLQGQLRRIDDRRRSPPSAPATRRTSCRCSRSARRR